MWRNTEYFCKVTKGKAYVKHCRYFFNKNTAGSLPLLYLLACLLGAAMIHVGIADCSFPAIVEESGSTNAASRKSVHRQVCKYAFYGCRDLCYICISEGDGELEVVVISNRCFSYCVGSRSEKGEQHHSICLCLKYLSAFFTLEVYSFTCIKAYPLWPSNASQDSEILSCHRSSSVLLSVCSSAPAVLLTLKLFKMLENFSFTLSWQFWTFQAVFLLPPVHEESQLATACTTGVVATFTN